MLSSIAKTDYLPEALLNYLVRLGWSHGDSEIFSLQEMISLFDIGDVNKAASVFNQDKLSWLNQHYIKEMKPEQVARYLSHHLGECGIDPASGPDITRSGNSLSMSVPKHWLKWRRSVNSFTGNLTSTTRRQQKNI